MSTLVQNQTTSKVLTSKVNKKIRLQIIAEYEAQKAAEAEAAKIEAERIEAEAAKIEAERIEAEAQKAAEAKKAEAKLIREGKKEVDNTILDNVLRPTEVLKYVNTHYGLNKDVEPSIWIEKLTSLNLIKAAQKEVINSNQLEQLTKSLSLVLAQMSNDDLAKFSADDKKIMPSKYLTLIVNGACKSAKSFKNSQEKLAAFQAKK